MCWFYSKQQGKWFNFSLVYSNNDNVYTALYFLKKVKLLLLLITFIFIVKHWDTVTIEILVRHTKSELNDLSTTISFNDETFLLAKKTLLNFVYLLTIQLRSRKNVFPQKIDLFFTFQVELDKKKLPTNFNFTVLNVM